MAKETFDDDNVNAVRTGEFKGAFETSGTANKDTFDDATNAFPYSNYYNSSSLNKASYGGFKRRVYLGGGDFSIDLDLPKLLPSKYPYNQVKETLSGHAIEIDDTPGAERIMIRHKTGTGVEMRPDGTMIMSSTNNTVKITGGDEKVIVEGDGEISYNGNLSLNVTGDFDLKVGGDFNVITSGDHVENIRGAYKQTVERNMQTTVKKNRSEYILGAQTETILGDRNTITKGLLRNYVEGNIEQLSGGDMILTAKDTASISSPNINIAASSLTAIGDSGTMGGDEIVYYGKTAHIDRVNTTSTHSTAMYATTFHGDLDGTASQATQAGRAGTAGALGAGGSGGSITDDTTEATNKNTVEPTTAIMSDYLNNSNLGVRQISIDPGDVIKNQIDKSVDYGGVSSRKLTTAEVRSKLRDPLTIANKKFIGTVISEGILSATYINAIPPQTGRIVGPETTPKRNRKIIGNNNPAQLQRFT